MVGIARTDKQIKMDTNAGCKIDLWYFMVGLIGLIGFKASALKLRVLIKKWIYKKASHCWEALYSNLTNLIS